MKYKCENCGFIHEGELFDGYICPFCRSSLQSFKLISKEEKVYNRVNIKSDNECINRVLEKCINCGVCSKTCENIVGIKYDSEKCDGICIGCGQCLLTCPTGAITPKYCYRDVLAYINNKDYKVVAMTSPAVRVSLGDAFGYPKGSFIEGKMVSSLKALGFDYVFDTSFGADLTSIEEAHELYERIKQNKKGMFTSCCPSWVKYASIYHPKLIPNLSTCKSPIGMESSIIKEYFAPSENIPKEKLIIVAIVPCTSKKEEIINSDCDFALTTSELAFMIREFNIDFKNLKDAKFDNIKGSSSGKIFGASSGVALSVLRSLYHEITNKDLKEEEISIKEKDSYKEIKVKMDKYIVKALSVSTMKNLESILPIINEYDLIEVMNCDGGCISGGGQIIMPIVEKQEIKKERNKSLFKQDKKPDVKYAYKNNVIISLYEDYLKENDAIRKSLLHTTFKDQSYLLTKKEEK